MRGRASFRARVGVHTALADAGGVLRGPAGSGLPRVDARWRTSGPRASAVAAHRLQPCAAFALLAILSSARGAARDLSPCGREGVTLHVPWMRVSHDGTHGCVIGHFSGGIHGVSALADSFVASVPQLDVRMHARRGPSGGQGLRWRLPPERRRARTRSNVATLPCKHPSQRPAYPHARSPSRFVVRAAVRLRGRSSTRLSARRRVIASRATASSRRPTVRHVPARE